MLRSSPRLCFVAKWSSVGCILNESERDSRLLPRNVALASRSCAAPYDVPDDAASYDT